MADSASALKQNSDVRLSSNCVKYSRLSSACYNSEDILSVRRMNIVKGTCRNTCINVKKNILLFVGVCCLKNFPK
jgi:hypothetical protein